MPSRIRHLDRGLRLNERVLGPVERLARMAGVSPTEIIEFLLEEIFEGEVAPPAAAPGPRAPIIPITRARRFRERRVTGIDLVALRLGAEELRGRAREVRRHAAAAREHADAAREKAARTLIAR